MPAPACAHAPGQAPAWRRADHVTSPLRGDLRPANDVILKVRPNRELLLALLGCPARASQEAATCIDAASGAGPEAGSDEDAAEDLAARHALLCALFLLLRAVRAAPPPPLRLVLSRNGLGDRERLGLAALLLRGRPGAVALDLSGNAVGAEGARALEAALGGGGGGGGVDVRGCRVPEGVAARLLGGGR